VRLWDSGKVSVHSGCYCCGSLLVEKRDSEAVSRKQGYIVPTQTQRTRVQRLSPKNKGVSPYIPLQAGYRSKKQGLVHIWLYLILLITLSQCYMTSPSLVLCDLPHVQISQVLSLCHAIPTSLLLSQDSGLVCFHPPLCYTITTYLKLIGLKQQKLNPHSLEAGKPMIKTPVDFLSGKHPLSGSQIAVFSMATLMVEGIS
jgi:hypothetical protein